MHPAADQLPIRSHRWQTLTLVGSLGLFWGGNWVAIKLSVDELPVFTYRSICLIIGAAGLFALAAWRGMPVRVARPLIGPLILTACLNIAAWHLLAAYGVRLIGAGRAAVLGYTMPIWAALLGALVLHERLTWRLLCALGLGMAGMVVLFLPGARGALASPLGSLLVILAAMSWAAGTIAAKHWRWGIPTVPFVAWQMLIASLPITILALALDAPVDWPALSLNGWAGLVYTAAVAMWFCNWAYFRLVETNSAALASLSTLVVPIFGVLGGALILGEPIGWPEAAALVLVIGAMVIAHR